MRYKITQSNLGTGHVASLVADPCIAGADDRSTIFARWRQCARPPNTRYIGPTPLVPNGSSIESATDVSFDCCHNSCCMASLLRCQLPLMQTSVKVLSRKCDEIKWGPSSLITPVRQLPSTLIENRSKKFKDSININ